MSWHIPRPDEEVFLNGKKLDLVLQVAVAAGQARIIVVDHRTGEWLFDEENGDYHWHMVTGTIELKPKADPRPIKERLDALRAERAAQAAAQKTANPFNPGG